MIQYRHDEPFEPYRVTDLRAGYSNIVIMENKMLLSIIANQRSALKLGALWGSEVRMAARRAMRRARTKSHRGTATVATWSKNL